MKKKFEIAEQDKVNERQKSVRVLLKALGHPVALVTDESMVSDFLDFFSQERRDKQLKRLEKKLGFPVRENDYVWQVAEIISIGLKGDK
jgi:hypothetical protein